MRMKTIKDLREYIDALYAAVGDGEIDDTTEADLDAMEVLVRVQDDDGNLWIGGLMSFDVTPGCTDVAMFVLDGMVDAESATCCRHGLAYDECDDCDAPEVPDDDDAREVSPS